MPEKPVPENDPLVQKSLATWYVVSMVLLMASLFWALWDEAFGQRPWKAYQHEWKDRYSAFLKTARSTSAQSEKEVESNGDYQKLKQDYEQANQQAAPRTKEINDQLRTLSAKILAVQNVFTDRRAYVNALTYDIETTTERVLEAKQAQRSGEVQAADRGRRVSGRQQGDLHLPTTRRNLQRPEDGTQPRSAPNWES